MSFKKNLAASLTAAVALTIGLAAAAQESQSVLGLSEYDQCAAAAANTGTGARPGIDQVQTCSRAIGRAHTTVGELAGAFLNRGVLRMARGETEQAIADFDRALKAQPTLAVAYNDRGIAQSSLHRYAQATADFTQALNLQPAHPEQVLFNRAMAFEDQGDLKHAYVDYRKAAELNPTWDKPAKELARFSVSRPPVS